MRVLITGGAGFIGSHIAEHFQGRAEVRVLDNLRTGYRHNLAAFDVEFIEGSVLDTALVRDAVQGVDFVFHCAALVSVPESMAKPCECVEANSLGTLRVLEAAADAGVKKFCLSSTSAIYGDSPEIPKREAMSPAPLSPYAITKLSGEYYCGMFSREGRLPTACLRYFNVFGPRQDPASQYAAAIPIFISRALANQPITVFGDGEQTRDFIYVKDVVAANAYFAEHPQLCGVYNVAYGRSITIEDLARRIVTLTGSAASVEHAPERPGDAKHSRAAIDRLTDAGFRAGSDFDTGLAETIAFFREQCGA